jgi:2-amino-4-hydroxy-6-hydroxymethyldihydropteridine diphosphokinase
MSDTVYLALGSNVGDRHEHLRFAREAIGRIDDTRIVAESDVEETAPIGPIVQDAYLNQMIAIETSLDPHALLAELQRIEKAGGRVRSVRWGPRTLDIDIVLIEGRTVDGPGLTVPHPELGARDFWRRELAQVRVAAQ